MLCSQSALVTLRRLSCGREKVETPWDEKKSSASAGFKKPMWISGVGLQSDGVNLTWSRILSVYRSSAISVPQVEGI